jgi:hypothetical protein
MSEQAEWYESYGWYKKKAAECQRQAVLVSEEHLKKVYLGLARQWLELAQQVEFIDRVRRKT